MEVDWFGMLDSDSIGISLFSADRQIEAWLEGAIDSDRAVIANGTLDFWGAELQADASSTVSFAVR